MFLVSFPSAEIYVAVSTEFVHTSRAFSLFVSLSLSLDIYLYHIRDRTSRLACCACGDQVVYGVSGKAANEASIAAGRSVSSQYHNRLTAGFAGLEIGNSGEGYLKV